MTPDQFDHAAEECTKALEEFALFMKQDNRSKEALGHLKEIIAIAKSQATSGPIAEMRDFIIAHVAHGCAGGEAKERCEACRMSDFANALAAQAQSAEMWRKRVEAAADALADVLPGEVGRLDLLARIAELKRQRNDAKEQARLGWERAAEKDRAYGDMISQRDEALGRCARLSAAGQVLSDHVDKAQGELVDTIERAMDDGMRRGAEKWAGGEMHGERIAPVGWTMRDEFAKAAIQGYCSILRYAEHVGEDTLAEMAYAQADAMLSARGSVVDFTPEQEHSWETEARKDAAEQMRAACLVEVQAYLDRIGLGHDAPMWSDIEAAIRRARVAM